MTDIAMDDKAAFVEAIKRNDRDYMAQLLARDPSLLRAHESDGDISPAMLATYYGNHEIAQDLLDQGVQADVFLLAVLGLIDRLASLLDTDPEVVAAYSADGWTALHLAGHFGQASAATLLLDHGADLAARSRNRNGNTALHAALAGRESETAYLLIERGADIAAADSQEWTPLHLAAHSGDLLGVEMLLERGADPHITNQDGLTARELAEQNGHETVARALRTCSSLA